MHCRILSLTTDVADPLSGELGSLILFEFLVRRVDRFFGLFSSFEGFVPVVGLLLFRLCGYDVQGPAELSHASVAALSWPSPDRMYLSEDPSALRLVAGSMSEVPPPENEGSLLDLLGSPMYPSFSNLSRPCSSLSCREHAFLLRVGFLLGSLCLSDRTRRVKVVESQTDESGDLACTVMSLS
jgi:hypothetical protein